IYGMSRARSASATASLPNNFSPVGEGRGRSISAEFDRAVSEILAAVGELVIALSFAAARARTGTLRSRSRASGSRYARPERPLGYGEGSAGVGLRGPLPGAQALREPARKVGQRPGVPAVPGEVEAPVRRDQRQRAGQHPMVVEHRG